MRCASRRKLAQLLALRSMSWISEEEEDNDPLDGDDFMPSDQSSDLFDDMPDEVQESWSEEENDDMYDPTDVEAFG